MAPLCRGHVLAAGSFILLAGLPTM